MNYEDYFTVCSKIVGQDIAIDGDAVIFYTDKTSVEYLDKQNIGYILMESKKEKIKKKILGKRGVIVGLILILFCVYINTYRVSEIIFNGAYPINASIEEELETMQKDLLFWSFSNKNYDSIARTLRAKYYQYEWITVSKKGAKLYVDIYPTTTKNMSQTSGVAGDIIANRSGIISQFKVFNGKPCITENQYVKRGEILISGNLLAGTDQPNVQYTNAKGNVLAYTYEEKTVIIQKKHHNIEKTGAVNSYMGVSFFGNNIPFQSTKFQENELKINSVFTIPYLFAVKKFHEYEKRDILYTYDKQNAIIYGKSLIQAEFNKQKVVDQEQIQKLEVLTIAETEESFTIMYLVKSLQSIGVFKEYER